MAKVEYNKKMLQRDNKFETLHKGSAICVLYPRIMLLQEPCLYRDPAVNRCGLDSAAPVGDEVARRP